MMTTAKVKVKVTNGFILCASNKRVYFIFFLGLVHLS